MFLSVSPSAEMVLFTSTTDHNIPVPVPAAGMLAVSLTADFLVLTVCSTKF